MWVDEKYESFENFILKFIFVFLFVVIIPLAIVKFLCETVFYKIQYKIYERQR